MRLWKSEEPWSGKIQPFEYAETDTVAQLKEKVAAYTSVDQKTFRFKINTTVQGVRTRLADYPGETVLRMDKVI